MSESKEHKELVTRILDYTMHLVPKENSGNIKADTDGYGNPSLIYSAFIPDVMYCYDNNLIIGEAKTLQDFDRQHSKEQYISYLEECSKHKGIEKIIIAVPWELFITAQNHFKVLKRKNKKYEATEIHILSSNGKSIII